MKWTAAAILFAAFSSAAVAFAQDADQPQTKFYDFGEMLIDGDLQKPTGMFHTERGRARFQSLLNLRRRFVQDIEKAAHDESMQ